ncbi:MAG TPA: hypothetical protein VNL77_00100 [Roseiflexaceae bacterium]|nr:hypothetical protein [Roseiflexaceae bacterium]
MWPPASPSPPPARLNHILLGLALVLARGKTWAETGMLDTETFVSDLILLLLGYVVAVL